MPPRYVRYTVVDAQSMQPCVTGDWPTYPEARRERDQLALMYGEQFGLRVGGIDAQGDLHLLDDAPYPSVRPQQSVTAREGAPAPERKRTGWIWVITISYAISSGWTLMFYYAIFSGLRPISAAEYAFYASLSSTDILLLVLINLLALSGVVALFLLRRIAFHLFVAALVASLLVAFWNAAGITDRLGAFGDLGLVIAILTYPIVYGIYIGICVYTWKLIKRGTLL